MFIIKLTDSQIKNQTIYKDKSDHRMLIDLNPKIALLTCKLKAPNNWQKCLKGNSSGFFGPSLEAHLTASDSWFCPYEQTGRKTIC